MTRVIAEVGSNHGGSIDRFRNMIAMAKRAGCWAVKGQAFRAEDVAANGSMPLDFYKSVELAEHHCLELVEWAENVVGIPLFFSIFSAGFERLSEAQKYQKVSGSQFEAGKILDREDAFVSIRDVGQAIANDCVPRRAVAMYVTPYLSRETTLQPLQELVNHVRARGRGRVGYSDHTLGIYQCMEARRLFGAQLWAIEKHVHDGIPVYWSGKMYRDFRHAVGEDDLTILAKG